MSEEHHDDPRPASADTSEAAFMSNLRTFGERAARISDLARTGRLSPEASFRALTHLWLQLARSHRRLERGPGEAGGDE